MSGNARILLSPGLDGGVAGADGGGDGGGDKDDDGVDKGEREREGGGRTGGFNFFGDLNAKDTVPSTTISPLSL